MWKESRRPVAAILLFDEVEVLDFAGPYEVLTACRDSSGGRRVDVFTVAQARDVTCTGGLRVQADHQLEGCPQFDALIVPGGAGAREVRPQTQAEVLDFIRDKAGSAAALASVCTGAFLLGRAGLLDGRTATTHTRRLELFRNEFPRVDVVAEKIVDHGSLITAAGVSSGVDLSLHLVERWFGGQARAESAALLDGPWI